jgi:hypothetical protein
LLLLLLLYFLLPLCRHCASIIAASLPLHIPSSLLLTTSSSHAGSTSPSIRAAVISLDDILTAATPDHPTLLRYS